VDKLGVEKDDRTSTDMAETLRSIHDARTRTVLDDRDTAQLKPWRTYFASSYEVALDIEQAVQANEDETKAREEALSQSRKEFDLFANNDRDIFTRLNGTLQTGLEWFAGISLHTAVDKPTATEPEEVPAGEAPSGAQEEAAYQPENSSQFGDEVANTVQSFDDDIEGPMQIDSAGHEVSAPEDNVVGQPLQPSEDQMHGVRANGSPEVTPSLSRDIERASIDDQHMAHSSVTSPEVAAQPPVVEEIEEDAGPSKKGKGRSDHSDHHRTDATSQGTARHGHRNPSSFTLMGTSPRIEASSSTAAVQQSTGGGQDSPLHPNEREGSEDPEPPQTTLVVKKSKAKLVKQVPLSSQVRDGANQGWLPSTRLSEAAAAQFDAESVKLARSGKHWQEFARLLTRQDRYDGTYCVQCNVISHTRHVCSLQNGNEACSKCVSAGRPCAKLVRIDGIIYLGWLPLPESNRDSAQWGALPYWIVHEEVEVKRPSKKRR
jgi:hypothetical protein